MNQTQIYFQSVISSQANALESLMANQPTQNPQLMKEAKELLEEAVIKAIQASRDIEVTEVS